MKFIDIVSIAASYIDIIIKHVQIYRIWVFSNCDIF
jgi:hypothetical protein